jgi:hypothetical protein
MAIGTPNALGTYTSSINETAGVITTSATAPTGSLIVVMFGGNSGTPTVTDSASNSYTVEAVATNAGMTCGIAWAEDVTQLTSGGTITSTGSSGRHLLRAVSVTGILTTSPVDQQNTRTQTTTNWTANAITTTQNDEIVVACCVSNSGATSTPNGTMTELGELAALFNFVAQYEILSATATFTAGGTLTAASDTAAKVVSFKAAPSGPTAPYVSVSVA